MKKLFWIFLLSLCVAPYVLSQETTRKEYTATRTAVPPVINGILDDEAWNSGKWIDDFTQNEPYNGRPSSQRTEFNILFDDNNLYVAIKAYDTSPDSIVNRLTRRDDTDGDLVGIILDSYHDLRTAFLFAVSSAGVKFDQVFTDDGQNEDPSWDPNWWVQTSVNKEGWVAEMKIPFSQVRFEKNSTDGWGLEVARVLYRKNETSFWQHIPKDAPGLVHLFGVLKGLDQIKPRKIFDITPYTVAKTETFQSDAENPFLAKGKLSKLNGGVDAKIGVTNNLTMDLTINPDFGQVEADPSEVNLTAYETFFKEKRPFFIEGNNITNFGLGIGDGGIGNDNLFYSRRIGRRPQGYPDLNDGWYADVPVSTAIIGAAKLTGKSQKGLSVGFIDAVTAEEKATIDTIGGTTHEPVEPLTNYFVGRVQKDINNGNTIIGGIFTGTNRNLSSFQEDYLHRAAYTGGVDFTQYFKDKNWMFNLNTAFSYVNGTAKAIRETQESSARYFQRPDNNYVKFDTTRTYLAGSGGRIQIMKLNGHWNFMGATIWKTPGFEINDLGYMREADQVVSVLWAGYNEWEPKGIYRNYNINSDIFTAYNFGGDWIAGGFDWNASMGFKNYWNVWTGGSFNFPSMSTGILRGGPIMKLPGTANFRLGFSTDNHKKLTFDAYARNSLGYENSSRDFSIGTELSYKPTNWLSLTLNPSFSKSFNKLQYVTQTDFNGTDRYVFASIDQKVLSSSLRVNVNLSPNLTVQYWGQPFVASGKYYDYKYITQPVASKFSNRFALYSPDQINLSDNEYLIDENRDGSRDYSFDRNDFNFQEFLSNLVIRWEYNPGSTLFLVWSQTRQGSNDTGVMDYANDLGNLFSRNNDRPHNIFLLKFSYRFGLK
jgi:hypothetical protein